MSNVVILVKFNGQGDCLWKQQGSSAWLALGTMTIESEEPPTFEFLRDQPSAVYYVFPGYGQGTLPQSSPGPTIAFDQEGSTTVMFSRQQTQGYQSGSVGWVKVSPDARYSAGKGKD